MVSKPKSLPEDPDVYPTGNIIADTICRTAELGLHITGAFDAGAHTVIEADAIDAINECSQCMQPRLFRDHRVRNLTNLPIVGFPTRLAVQLPYYRCIDPPATLSISLQVLVALPMAQKSPTGSLGSLCSAWQLIA